MIYKLKREQQLNCEIGEAWDFFSSPANLSRITPKDMGFVVLSDVPEGEIKEGLVIDYTVSPLLGIPLKWKTKITQVDYRKSFSDYQLKGPYKLWNHHHEFIPNKEGVLMIDSLEYELPLGILGQIAHRIMVKRKIESIFNYRNGVLNKMFNQGKK